MHCSKTGQPPSFSHQRENESEQEDGYHTGFIGRAFAVLGAASAAAAAVEGRRRPKASDLRTLGIDPANFPDTRRD